MNTIIYKLKSINYYLLILMVLMILLSLVFQVKAFITVSPTRLILENGQRSATVKLINPDNETATYRISILNIEMTEGGDFEEVELSDNRENRLESYFAQDLIRFSPRQVILPPRQSQIVRVQVMIPADIKDGEYRSHMLFQEIPNQSQERDQNEAEESVGISLRAIYGVSIPVIIRHGDTGVNLEISNLYLKNNTEDGIPELSLEIQRSGNQSVYGDIEVSFMPEEGPEKIIAAVRGTAIYTDIDKREYNIKLNGAEDIFSEKGTLKVIYKKAFTEEEEILAKNELEL